MIPLIADLFAPSDLVELRLIETWVDAGKKRSRFVQSVFDRAAGFDATALATLNAYCAVTNANAFLGVCPRAARAPGRSGTINCCRSLWGDLDHCRPREAIERIDRAGLPPASVVVVSGNGSHVYWLLDEPLTLTVSGHPDALCPQASHVEAVLKGLSAKIDGDHTSDLARLLRLPGTLNRKDARSGRPPVPCEIYDRNGRHYPFSLFQPFAASEPHKAAKSYPAVPSGVPRSAGREWDGLTENQRRVTARLIDRCASAGVGSRSGADYALCSWAAKLGLDPDELWGRVADVGKFAELGERYFWRTWNKAGAAVEADQQRLAELYGI
ncbi:hypothetical protein J0H58_16525 [bacterium]|nr:hypothetical protein [bacterium]